MRLSDRFAIDTGAHWVRTHNDEVRRVISAWRADRPVRVPLLCADSAIQHGLYAGQVGMNYRAYYSDPDEMVRVQLEAARFRREQPIYDMELGVPPESWPIVVDFHPVPSQGWVGCELLFRDDASPAHRPMNLSREQCDAMEMPDPATGGILKRTQRFVAHIREHWVGKRTFLGRPIGPLYEGVDHNGFFALALDVRGQELLTDFYEDPEFVRRFLLKMATWCDALEKAWMKASPNQRGYFRNTDHGIDMLSAEMYEEFILPVVLEMNRRRGTPLPSGWHYCGKGMHLIPVFRKHYPLERLDDVTWPVLDLAAARKIVGDRVWIKGQIDDGIVHTGPAERIRDTVRELMESGIKDTARFALSVGDMLGSTPMEHRVALYEAVREFGSYRGGEP